MTRIHQALAALVPGPRSDWITAHGAELATLEEPALRRRWALGVISVAVSALWAQLRTDPRSYLGGVLVKTVVAGVSVVNVLAGLALVAVFLTSEDQVLMMLALAATLVTQGTYTLVVLAGGFGSLFRTAVNLQVAASTLALVAGAIAFGIGLASNINLPTGDPEYGPMTVAMLLAIHGATSLLSFIERRNQPKLSK
ncbi:MAG: hypothetical protein V3W36_01440 [Acidimicrobiia bacterium]